ncbi:hypothetical protein GALL_516900 [mine drainage metagenome]|uniref:Uncharacterized protein n=1 Tax=mine drainage metagenome TaxID=410659 RepID=A0A1J5PN72_9ZZZZ
MTSMSGEVDAPTLTSGSLPPEGASPASGRPCGGVSYGCGWVSVKSGRVMGRGQGQAGRM